MTTTIEWAWTCLDCNADGHGAKADLEARKHTESTGHVTTTAVTQSTVLGGPRVSVDPIAQARADERAAIVEEIRTFAHRGIPLAPVIADHIAKGGSS